MRKAWIAYGVFLILVLMNVYFQLVLTDSHIKKTSLYFTLLYLGIMVAIFKKLDTKKRTLEENEEVDRKNRKHFYAVNMLLGGQLFFRLVFRNSLLDTLLIFTISLYGLFLITKYFIERESHCDKK